MIGSITLRLASLNSSSASQSVGPFPRPTRDILPDEYLSINFLVLSPYAARDVIGILGQGTEFFGLQVCAPGLHVHKKVIGKEATDDSYGRDY